MQYLRAQQESRRPSDGKDQQVHQFITGVLRLKVNEAKSAVAQPWERKFLGFTFATPYYGIIKVAVAPKAVERFKERVRQLTRRQRGVSLARAGDGSFDTCSQNLFDFINNLEERSKI